MSILRSQVSESLSCLPGPYRGDPPVCRASPLQVCTKVCGPKGTFVSNRCMISVTGEQPELCLSTLEMGSVDTAELPEISQAAGTDEACSCEIQWKKFL